MSATADARATRAIREAEEATEYLLYDLLTDVTELADVVPKIRDRATLLQLWRATADLSLTLLQITDRIAIRCEELET